MSWLGAIPIQQLFFLEILFLIINFGSIAVIVENMAQPVLMNFALMMKFYAAVY
ncbi:MAG: hypothetical protein CM1200mP28_03200 [Deltaproteobacteria bacterium]|nr:MAG: hypothetical protein CM1200mP28_03200 [Deltaproteobacteria bacterium]